MPTVQKDPDIRIGLIGLRQSGKTHFVTLLNKAFWHPDYDSITLEFEDEDTALLFHEGRKTIYRSEFIGPSRPGQVNLYRLAYEANRRLNGFQHILEILDVDGEVFEASDRKIYREWLTNCNALIILIDGEMLERDAKKPDNTQTEHLLLFERVLDLIRIHLRPAHNEKHKIHITFCVSKYDLFESKNMVPPEELVKTKLPSIYADVEKMRKNEKSWAVVEWMGFSAVGFIWDSQGQNYADEDGNPVSVGSRKSQRINTEEGWRIYNPMMLRPEGIGELFEHLRKTAIKSGMKLDPLDPGDALGYTPQSKPDDPRSPSTSRPRRPPSSLGSFSNDEMESADEN